MKRPLLWIPLFALLVLTGVLGMTLLHGGDPDAVASPLTGEVAPALDVATLDGVGPRLTTATLKGKPHLLNFFASWCGPCAEENSILMGIARSHQIDILGVAMKDNADPLHDYLRRHGNPYDVVALDEAGRTAIDWGVSGVPETFAIDANGMIVARHVGQLDDDGVVRLMKSLQQPAK